MTAVLALLLAYGLCFGVMHKADFLFPPSVDPLRSCAYCTGFHSGWLSWLVFAGLGHRLLCVGSGVACSLLAMIAWAFISAAVCYILDTLIMSLETQG